MASIQTTCDFCDLCRCSGVSVARTTYCGQGIGIECGCDAENEDGTCGDQYCTKCGEAVRRAKRRLEPGEKWLEAMAKNPEIGGDHDHSMNA